MKSLMLACLLLAGTVGVAADTFRVTTLRASPGKLETLVDEIRAYRSAQKGKVIVMRHSQGDHWDLMLLEPAEREPDRRKEFSPLVDCQLDFLADSDVTFAELSAQADKAGLYHIEMFHALAGKQAALIDQRERENAYLAATGQVTNFVFVTRFGSDVDVFTLGFHKDMGAFAAGPSVSDEEAEQAARDAGFKNRADLGYFLRSLLIRHQDTLAVPVR